MPARPAPPSPSPQTPSKTPLTADDAAALAERVLAARYPQADAGFAAGSLVRGGATASSDLDLVVLSPALPHAHRESFLFEATPVDAFAHDPQTLRAFFGKDIAAGRPAMLTMVAEGRIVGPRPAPAQALQAEAQATLAKGPPALDAAALSLWRYLITSRLEDLEDPRPWPETAATAVWLYPALAEFVLRANGRWAATAKWVPRALAAFDPALAGAFDSAFAALFERRDTAPLVRLGERLLAPFGGRLFDGFHADAPPQDRAP
ncbi:hypothetical protein ACO2Q3_26265 [Caulobacter sp. KR2-114]|uniref:hypothetical protein n=1 Tax=Caulobacter sp. KR2-114 TaxID=3400912 RepID=UPI003C00A198